MNKVASLILKSLIIFFNSNSIELFKLLSLKLESFILILINLSVLFFKAISSSVLIWEELIFLSKINPLIDSSFLKKEFESFK